MSEVSKHWDRVGQLPCVVSGRRPTTLHHAHGGSMTELLGKTQRGMGQKNSDWLVLPLHADYHLYDEGIDSGMTIEEWEDRFGSQADLLADVCLLLGVNVFRKAGLNVNVVGLDTPFDPQQEGN